MQLDATHPEEVCCHAPETRVAVQIVADGLEAGVLHVASSEVGAYFLIGLKRLYNLCLLGMEFGATLQNPASCRHCIEGLGGPCPTGTERSEPFFADATT